MDILWNNTKAISCYVDIAAKFGVPSFLSSIKGGSAKWSRSQLVNTPFYEIEVKDQTILIDGKEQDRFLIATVKYDLHVRCHTDIFQVCDKIGYDGTEKTLWSRSGDYESCLAILVVITSLANCVISEQQFLEGNLLEKAVSKSKTPDTAELFRKQLETNLIEQPSYVGLRVLLLL